MPTLHDVPEVAQLLAAVLTAEPVTHGALAVIPLLAPNLDDPDWLTLEEAGDHVRVTEVSEAGTVPFLKVVNEADQPLLLLDGEELVGAKQNRILNTTVLVAAHAEVIIPVSCVEQGRWNEVRKDFESRSSVVQPSVRSEVLGKADQGRIWSGVAAATRAARAAAPTGSYQAVYESSEVRGHLDRTTRPLEIPVAGALGAAVFVGQSLAGVDAFHADTLFAREWPKLLRAYALDAYGATPGGWDEAAARTRVDGLLRGAARAVGTIRASAGAGRLFEFAIDNRRGAALLVEGQALHLAIL